MTAVAQAAVAPVAHPTGPTLAVHPDWQAYLDHRGECPQCAQTTFLCPVGGHLLRAARTPLGSCTSCREPVYAGEEQYVVVREATATTRELVHRAPCADPEPADTS